MTLRRRALLSTPVWTLGCAGAGRPPSAASKILDRPLPAFLRPALIGEPVDTRSSDGHLVVVKFFAKYCAPCKRTLPAVERMYEDNSDAIFIGIAEDEARADVEWMIRRYQLTFPVVHDEGNRLAEQFGISKLPYAFVADRRGIVRWVGGPKQTERDLEAALEWVRSGAESE